MRRFLSSSNIYTPFLIYNIPNKFVTQIYLHPSDQLSSSVIQSLIELSALFRKDEISMIIITHSVSLDFMSVILRSKAIFLSKKKFDLVCCI